MANAQVTVAISNARIARDAETKVLAGGKTVTTFAVAVNQWDSSTKQPVTRFIDCESWSLDDATAALCRKGNLVTIINAPLAFREYQKRDGTLMKTERISVSRFNLFFDSSCAAGEASTPDQEDVPFE